MVNRRARFVMGCGVVSVSTLCANDKKAKREMTADKREAKAIGASPSVDAFVEELHSAIVGTAVSSILSRGLEYLRG
jgi:hypothetical protein